MLLWFLRGNPALRRSPARAPALSVASSIQLPCRGTAAAMRPLNAQAWLHSAKKTHNRQNWNNWRVRWNFASSETDEVFVLIYLSFFCFYSGMVNIVNMFLTRKLVRGLVTPWAAFAVLRKIHKRIKKTNIGNKGICLCSTVLFSAMPITRRTVIERKQTNAEHRLFLFHMQ